MKRVKEFLKHRLQTGVCYLGVFAMIACNQNSISAEKNEQAEGLVGYWKLEKDCRDYSGKDNHGVNHGVNFGTGEWKKAYVEVPSKDSINFGAGDFSISALVYTEKDMTDVVGDIMSKYDAEKRKGFNLNIAASAPGYSSQGNDKHVYFGIDNGTMSEWEDCGRPMADCNFVTALTVFNGDLYVGTSDSTKAENWCHVFRYRGNGKWEDCGRLDNRKITTANAMVVHDGNLYVTISNYGWTNWENPGWGGRPKRSHSELDTESHVYRYKGGKEWEDCGKIPGKGISIRAMASYKGKLFVSGFDCGVCEYEGGTQRKQHGGGCQISMAVLDGKLYVGKGGEVVAYDGQKWVSTGNPCLTNACSQIHCLEGYRGELYAGTWPLGKIAVYRDGKWVDCGKLPDTPEIYSFVVYNGKFYTGTIPYADIFRYEGTTNWTHLKRFVPQLLPTSKSMTLGSGAPNVPGWRNYARPTSLTIYDGKLYLSLGSGSSNLKDAPCDNRGKVFCMEVGKNVSYDKDMGFGWKHVAAVKKGGKLKLYVNGDLVKESSTSFNAGDYDVSNNEPLKIGFGEMNYFSGKIKEVRLYNKVLGNDAVQSVYNRAMEVCK